MNCLDFRRAYLTDPYHLEDEQKAHLVECDACARYANRQTAAERHLEAALRISAPKDLGANVIFERSMRGRRNLRFFAMAAGVVLTVAATFAVTMYSLDSDLDHALQKNLIAHMQHDPMHQGDVVDDAYAVFQQVATSMGITMDGSPGNIVAARHCDIDGKVATHLVLEEHGVRATAFLMPNQSVAEHEWMDGGDGQHGMLIPVKGGTIAVFCPERQMLVRIGEQLQRSVQWSS